MNLSGQVFVYYVMYFMFILDIIIWHIGLLYINLLEVINFLLIKHLTFLADLATVRPMVASGDVISVTSESNEGASSEESVRCCSPPMKEVDAKVSMLKWCTEVFKSCAKRYPRHAKSLYRLAEMTATKMRDPEAALKFLYFPEVRLRPSFLNCTLLDTIAGVLGWFFWPFLSGIIKTRW